MSIYQIAAPNLAPLAVGGTTLYLLEGLGFSQDGNSLLVRATFTDDADTSPGTLHHGVWVYDLTSQQYTRCLNSELAGSAVAARSLDIQSASIIGAASNISILAETSIRGSGEPAKLALLKAGSIAPDLLATLLEPDAQPRIERHSLSQDGRFLALQTDSGLLAPVNSPDTNEVSDIYLIDLTTRQVTRISFVGKSEVNVPVQLGNVFTQNGQVQIAFTTDGVFSSKDSNSATNAPTDVYLWSQAFDGSGLSGMASFRLVSAPLNSQATGSVVGEALATSGGTLFTSASGNLVSADNNGQADAFLNSSTSNLVTRLSLTGLNELDAGASLVSASENGRFVALLTTSSQVAKSTGAQQLVALDLQTGSWLLASGSGSALANNDVIGAVIAPNGVAVAFTTLADNLTSSEPVALGGSLLIAMTGFTLNIAPTGSVTLNGTTTQGQTLSASNNLADVDGLGTISYQWKANGSTISGATSSTLTLTEAQVGKTISVTASYTDGQGTAESVTSSATAAVANVNDAPTGSVTLSGTATQGQTLSAANNLADADGLGTISYQWKANGSTISGATGNSLTLTEAQVGKAISVTASYTDGHGTAESVISSATAAVANVNDAPTGTVTLNGTATLGQTLSASNNLADVDGLGTITYQWLADGVTISGATASTFNLTQAQVGKSISVKASYTDGHGTAETMTSAATAKVVGVNTAPTGSVTISGTTTQGKTLTATNTLADADGLGTISYQWLADGITISDATASTLTLTQAQVGKAISVKASYTDAFGTPESKISTATAKVANVNDTPTGTVTITGTVTQGQKLTATNTLADADGLGTIAYQWLADGIAISGATASTFALTQAQVGKAISVKASYTDSFKTAESVTSGSTTKVANVNDAPTGSVTVAGTATQGQKLTAANTLADADGLGTISYQWLADGTAISGATASTFTLTQAQVGKFISVKASYTDKLGTAESSTSAVTAMVASSSKTGTAAADTLAGSTGNDLLSGMAGNDVIYGGLGNDTLIGGAGADRLTGGAGNDSFKFSALTDLGLGSVARDTITDFKSGEDKIDLSAIDTNAGIKGDQAFVWVTNFTSTAGQVRFATDGQGSGIVYLNTDTDIDAEFEIMLTGVTSLAASNLVL